MPCLYRLSAFIALQIITSFGECEPELGLGITDFSQLIRSNHTFIDKTELIKDIIHDNARVVLITQPRKFGKSLSLSMLQHFLDIKKAPQKGTVDLFNDLKISADKSFCQSHKNQYPVIHISFENITATDYRSAELQIFSLLQNLYRQHSYLLEDESLNAFNKLKFLMILNRTASIDSLKNAIFSLCDFLGNKKPLIKAKRGVILLVDDYDKPLEVAYLNNYLNQMELLISHVLSCLQSSPFVHKAVVLGSNAVTLKTLPKLNTIFCTVLNGKHTQYFGFTEAELNDLNTPDVKQLAKWYSYNISGTIVYNPWSILSCLKNGGKIGPYWVRTPSNELVLHLLSLAGMNEAACLKYLLSGGTLDKEIHEKLSLELSTTEEEYFWTVLVHGGYLTATYAYTDAYRVVYSLGVPNEEVKGELISWCEKKFRVEVRAVSKDLDSFVESIGNGEVHKFGDFITKSLLESGVYYDFQKFVDVRRYHDYILGLFTPLRENYTVKYRRTEGSIYMGRRRCYDVTLLPRNESRIGWVVELVVTIDKGDMKEKARMALGQIKESNFTAVFRAEDCGKVVAVGVAFWRQRLELDFERFEF